MNIWDQLVDCICRPPRDVYNPAELLGGSNETFMVGAMECTRLDYELVNKQGMKLQCSHYFPLDAKSQDGKLPVVVYCHCNSGSRRDAEEAVYHLLPCGVGVVAFDFTGSGLSDGKWVTLGAHEVEDLGVVVQHLRSQGGISSIGLWGRSMGAVTALLYSHLDHDIAGMVLDSPFSRLTDLMLEIVVSQRLPIPKMMLKLALRLMRNSVKRKAGCDISTVSPLDVVPRSAIPAMFGHGEEDSFINIHHSVKLFEAYNTTADAPVYKNLVRFKGDHNHPRPAFFYSSVCCFFHQQLKLDQVLLGGNPADTQQLMQFGSLALSSAHEVLDRANGFINTPWSLEPVSSMSPEDQAAAAAAATAALMADDAGANGAASGGSAGGSGHGNSSSSAAALGSSCSHPSSPLRVAVPSGAGAQGGGAPGGVVHISEGGLNSPRASPLRDKGRRTVSVDACASSCGSSGGGRHTGAAGMGRSSSGGLDGHQQVSSGGPGSPISPLGQQQHRQQHLHAPHHPQHHRRHHQQTHSHQQQPGVPGVGRMGSRELQAMTVQQHQQQQHAGYQQDPSWQLASAVPLPAARGGQSAGAMPGCPSDELFTIGSRGAPVDALEHAVAAGSSGGGARSRSAHLSKSAPESRGSTAAAAAAAAAGEGADVQQEAAAVDAAGGRRGTSSGGSFVAASGQHLKWLFRRSGSGSSTPRSTPSTSPPVAGAAAEGGSGLWRPRSSGGGHGNGTAATAGADAAQQQGWPAGHDVGLPQQQRQHTHGALHASSESLLATTASKASRTSAGPAVTAAAAGPVGEEEYIDPDLAAAIAASLADQQQQPAKQGSHQQLPLLQQQGSIGSRLPGSLEEEERMLREAIALSLAVSGTDQEQSERTRQQQRPPAAAAAP